ncbi:cytochrome P450 [Bombardia bombarda]|uniref:Cytochrome P450 n=1 Tax=Bombardia bombarda TaxID=252184 RepID=A0AA39WHW3_9PEZI|nr:cytochrome P450 [Bombardia bombarda]
MMHPVILLIGGAVVVLAAWIFRDVFTLPGLRAKNLPPGPPALPLLGNLTHIPKTGIHLRFAEWANQYGSVFSLKIGHGTIVVLSSFYHATELLDKRSLHYSNRPPSHVVGKLVFRGDHPMFMDPDERWKLRRKLYNQLISGTRCTKDHMPLIEAESVQLLRDLCLEPEGLMRHPGRVSNSIIMTLVFGIRTPRYDTHHYAELNRIMDALSELGETGATPPVDIVPLLKYLPEFLWGNWKTRAAKLSDEMAGLYGPLIARVVERREKIGRSATFLDGVLDQQEKLRLTQNEIEVMCGNLMEGGTDTMASTLLSFFQAMANFPEVQKEAQRQMDLVFDEQAMPAWSDFEKLPYVNMIIKETLRWRPPGPGGFPHAAAKDDVIDGMKIPKGTAVFLNIWGLHHDAVRFAQPEIFDPSRYEGMTQLASVYANSSDCEKRDHWGYGAGRRICPGIHLAERALFVAVARMIWAFDFLPKIDAATGKPIPINIDPATGYHDGFLSHHNDFEVDIRVRSERRKEVIFSEMARAEVEVFSNCS